MSLKSQKNVNHDKKPIVKKQHHDYYIKSKVILDNLENELAFKMKKLPAYIDEYHKSNLKKEKSKKAHNIKVDSSERNYVYDKVYTISSKVAIDNELDCVSLNNVYERCKGKVKYIHENVNSNNDNFNFKKNLPLCARHLKEMMASDNKIKLKFGYYYESELYDRQEYKPV